MIPAPRNLLSLAALLVLCAVALAIALALRFPVMGLGFEASSGEPVLRVSHVSHDSPNRGQIFPGTRIEFVERLLPGADLLVEEPDQLGEWSRYNAVIDTLNFMDRSLAAGAIAVLVDGEPGVLWARDRRLGDLPPMFWFQVLVGSAGFLAAAGVFAYRPREPAAMHFLLAGLGMLVFATAAAIYSTRELVMSGELLRQLSSLNQFGANFFTAALVALLWVYPRRLSERVPMVPLAYALGVLIWAGFALQAFAEIGFVYVSTLLLFGLSFVFAAMQWRKTRGQPVERAALKWYLLAIYIGTGLFAAIILVPVAFGVEPPASQGMMFVVFLFMFLGIALGILRYRLFDLDRWWFGAWLWFVGGLAVLVVDLALISLLGMSQSGALLVSLALLGWVYFPVRQWAWSLLARRRAAGEWRRSWLRELAAAGGEEALVQRWRTALKAEFGPLEVLLVPNSSPVPRIEDDGQTLVVPDLIPGRGVRLSFPQRGGRLFSRDDLQTAAFLVELAGLVRDAMREREALVRAERQRIRRDLHDDLGAKLLSLVHRGDPEGQRVARSAIQDMRDILSALDAGDLALQDAAAVWHAEARQRAAAHGFVLAWDDGGLAADRTAGGGGSVLLTARQHTNLMRILREAITNAVRHAGAEWIGVELRLHDGDLELRVDDRGPTGAAPPEEWVPGGGTRQIVRRATDLDGSARWEGTPDGTRLRVSVPLGAEQAAFPGQESGTAPTGVTAIPAPDG